MSVVPVPISMKLLQILKLIKWIVLRVVHLNLFILRRLWLVLIVVINYKWLAQILQLVRGLKCSWVSDLLDLVMAWVPLRN